jgi:putative CocE/NonD family hydrolase
MSKRSLRLLILPAALAAAVLYIGSSPTVAGDDQLSRPLYSVRREFNTLVPMRDGVRLSTDIYRPDAPGRFPVVLERTPYDNSMHSSLRNYSTRGEFFASRGYVFAVQDVRGRYDSEGEWYPLIHEAEDGYDAQEWAGTQSWSSGKVGTIGGSYGGWDQWLPAQLGNSHLACMVPYVAPPNPFKNFPYENGALLTSAAGWMLMMDGHTDQTFGEGVGESEDVNELAYDWSKIARKLPTSQLAENAGRKVGWWKDWMEHDSYDSYWKRLDYQSHYDRISVPAFHVTGWYDGDFPGSFMNYPGMVKSAKTEFARKNQRIIIGPWPHGVNMSRQLGSANFGDGATVDLERAVLRWFDRWLKGIDNGIDREPPVHIFVMGDNEWRAEKEWPLARTEWKSFYLHSQGRANTALGDGSLSLAEGRSDEATDRYLYDPKDPTPETGALYGPDYVPEVSNRADVLVYQTPPMQDATEVTGPVTLKLYAASSAPDTDFFSRLADVGPNGQIHGLGHGIIRARFRESNEKAVLLERGKVYEYTIDLWPTSNVFKKGHRIRLDISSAAYPTFFPNLNTGKNNQTSTEMQTASQTIYHDGAHPSRLVLPIIPSNDKAKLAGR